MKPVIALVLSAVVVAGGGCKAGGNDDGNNASTLLPLATKVEAAVSGGDFVRGV